MASLTELKLASTSDFPAPSMSNGGTTVESGGDTAATAATTATTAIPSLSLSAVTHIASTVPSLESIKEQLGSIWSRSRPWGEFANTAQMNKPEFADLFNRVKENAEYYAFNYIVVLLCLSVLNIIIAPFAFMGGVVIAAAYYFLYILNPEPIVIAGLTINNNIKAFIIILFSLVILWLTGAGSTFTTLIVFGAFISFTHATFRRPPGEADFESEYTPATV